MIDLASTLHHLADLLTIGLPAVAVALLIYLWLGARGGFR